MTIIRLSRLSIWIEDHVERERGRHLHGATVLQPVRSRRRRRPRRVPMKSPPFQVPIGDRPHLVDGASSRRPPVRPPKPPTRRARSDERSRSSRSYSRTRNWPRFAWTISRAYDGTIAGLVLAELAQAVAVAGDRAPWSALLRGAAAAPAACRASNRPRTGSGEHRHAVRVAKLAEPRTGPVAPSSSREVGGSA